MKSHELADKGLIETISMKEFSPDRVMLEAALQTVSTQQGGFRNGFNQPAIHAGHMLPAGGPMSNIASKPAGS